jgi:lipopolysaccharide export system protein LptA
MHLPKNKFSLLLCLLLASHAAASFAERGDREKPMQMEADRVTVDDPKQTSTFEGNVQMHQGTLLIEANKIVVTQDTQGNSLVKASGQPAHFRQKRDGANEYADGYGERIEYDSQAEIANIYGQARVKREGDDVRGEHIIYNTKTGIFQVFGDDQKNPATANKGRVTIVIQPKEQTTETAPTAQPTPVKPAASQPSAQP